MLEWTSETQGHQLAEMLTFYDLEPCSEDTVPPEKGVLLKVMVLMIFNHPAAENTCKHTNTDMHTTQRLNIHKF